MTWWHYLLLVNFYLVLFFGFYALLLRRETFFQLNRIYLVAAALLSFIIPVIEADWVKNLFITQEVQQTIYNIPIGIPIIFAAPVETGITLGQVLNVIYICVTLFLLIRLAWQLVVLKKAIEKPTPSAAYTFFKKISLGENVAQSKVINDHEQVHANQWHSVDVMIIEAVMIINWFNPVVYLYRFAIKYIHEFIADSHVINAGADKADYAMLLLTQTFDVQSHNLVNQFYNHSLLKKRIMMLQKNKSHRIALAKYGLSAPLFMLMMVFSSATVNESKAVVAISNKTEATLEMPATDLVEAITDNAQIPAENLKEEETKAIVELPFGVYYVEPAYPELPTDMAPVDHSEVYNQVDKQPTFPGGLEAFGKFIGNTVIFPPTDREKGISGKVILTFVVEKDGSLSNVQAVSGPSEEMKAEAIRTLKLSPKWEPGRNNNQLVRVSYTVPIAFTLETEDEQPSFPGGLESFGRYLAINIKYPPTDRNAGIQGRVILTFVVEADGTLSDIKAVRSPSQSLADEAIRVMRKSPKWRPGTKNGKAARFAYSTPVSFSLSTDEGNVIKTENAGVFVPSTTGAAKSNSNTSGMLQTNEVVIRGYVKRTTAAADDHNGAVFSQVEKQPQFPGGLEAFGKFLGDNLKYPKTDRDKKTTGTAIVTFIVERDGSLNEIKALRGPSQAMMDEAVLVLTKSPKWQPGYQNGNAVRVSYTIPIAFDLNADNKKAAPIGIRTPTILTPTSPLYVIDGVVLDNALAAKYGFDQTSPGVSPLSLIPQEDIASMEILKDATATDRYGDRGKYGVILITTNKGKKAANVSAPATGKILGISVAPATVNGKTVSPSKASVQILQRGLAGKITPTSPLYVIDGKVVKPDPKAKGVSPLSEIKQEDIASIDVLKDSTATAIYGDAGKYGVIIITTKKAKK